MFLHLQAAPAPEFYDLLFRDLGPAAIVLGRWLLIGVLPRWSLIFAVVRNHLHRFFWRPLVLVFVFALRKCPDRHYAEHR